MLILQIVGVMMDFKAISITSIIPLVSNVSIMEDNDDDYDMELYKNDLYYIDSHQIIPKTQKNMFDQLLKYNTNYNQNNPICTNDFNKSLPLSAPVTPDHSPPTEKNTINNNINTQPKYDSLLDKIMALPRETIETRIKQFGSNVNNDDETRILVTKLFQLLSGHSNHKKSQSIELQSIETQPIQVTIENNTSLIMHHVGSHGNLQHLNVTNVNNANNLGNLNIVKSSYNSEIVSSAQSIHNNTPPKIEQRLIQPQISSNITSISPQNELVYQHRQISQESIKSNHSFTSHSHSHSYSHSHSPKSLSIISNNNNNNNDKLIDSNIELPTLDKTIDDIALELEEVDGDVWNTLLDLEPTVFGEVTTYTSRLCIDYGKKSKLGFTAIVVILTASIATCIFCISIWFGFCTKPYNTFLFYIYNVTYMII